MSFQVTSFDHEYRPVGKLREVFRADNEEVLVEGPAGTGKSRAILEKMVQLALKYPDSKYLMVRKTRDTINYSVAESLKRDVIPHLLASGHVEHTGGSPKQPAQYKFFNGSAIMTAGMDDPDKIKSTEYDFIFVNEATQLTERDWNYLTTRLRNGKIPRMQMMADCNPDTPHHWLNKRADTPSMRRIRTTHADNPRFWENGDWTDEGRAYISRLENMTGVERERLLKGIWAASDGLVYSTFDPSVHVVSEPLPASWPRFWSIDFGWTDPFVCQIWAVDADGRMFLESEVYMTGRTIAEHCKTLRPYAEANRPRAVVCDSASPEGMEQVRKELHVNVVKAKKDIAVGINLVKERLKPESPRIFFKKDSLVTTDNRLEKSSEPTRTTDEFLSYAWSKNKPDVPQDKYNHGMDAMRYMVMHLDQRSAPRMRIISV